MFATSQFATVPFAHFKYGYRELVESTGDFTLSLTVDFRGNQIASGKGTLTQAVDFQGRGGSYGGGKGTITGQVIFAGVGAITAGGSGTFSGAMDVVAYGVLYEMPHDTVDLRLVKVGFRLYQWRQELGRWTVYGWAPGHEPPGE